MVEEKKLIKLIRIATGRLSKLFLDSVLRIVAKCVSACLDLLFQCSAFQWWYLRSITPLWRRWNDLATLWMRPTAAGRRFAGAITFGTKPNHSFWPSFANANLQLWGSILIVKHRDTEYLCQRAGVTASRQGMEKHESYLPFYSVAVPFSPGFGRLFLPDFTAAFLKDCNTCCNVFRSFLQWNYLSKWKLQRFFLYH